MIQIQGSIKPTQTAFYRKLIRIKSGTNTSLRINDKSRIRCFCLQGFFSLILFLYLFQFFKIVIFMESSILFHSIIFFLKFFQYINAVKYVNLRPIKLIFIGFRCLFRAPEKGLKLMRKFSDFFVILLIFISEKVLERPKTIKNNTKTLIEWNLMF